MSDYVESPIDPLVSVGWSTLDKPDLFKRADSFTKPTSNHRGLNDSCITDIDNDIDWDDNTVYSLQFTVLQTEAGFRNDATHTLMEGAILTGQTSGATFQGSDFNPKTEQCTLSGAGFSAKKWIGGSSLTPIPALPDNFVAYTRIFDTTIVTSGFLFLQWTLWGNSNLGFDTTKYNAFINAEKFAITWPDA